MRQLSGFLISTILVLGAVPAAALCPSGLCTSPVAVLAAPTTAWQTATYDLTCATPATYQVTLFQGQSYTFTLCGASCPGANAPFDSTLELYQGATLVATNTGFCGDDGQIVYQTDPFTGAGTYCVRVIPQVGTGTFTLGYRITCQPPSNVLLTPVTGGTAVAACSADQTFYANTAGTGSFTYNWLITPAAGNTAVPTTRLVSVPGSSDQMPSTLTGLGDYNVDVTISNDCGSVTESMLFTLTDRVGPEVTANAVACGPIAPRDESRVVVAPPPSENTVAEQSIANPDAWRDNEELEKAAQPALEIIQSSDELDVWSRPGTRSLTCATPCRAATLQVNHPFYDVFVNCSNGTYTSRTGPSHSVTALGAAPQNVIYGGTLGIPSTSDLTLFVHNNNTQYQDPANGAACAFNPADTAAEPNNVGIEIEWTLATGAAGLGSLTFREEVVAFGATEADSGIRLTMKVTNPASSTVTANIGFAWQIDYQNSSDDGPGFAPVKCRPFTIDPERFTEYELPPSEVSDFYRIRNNTGSPIFSNFTSTAPMAGFPDTGTPDRLVYGVWGTMRRFPWNYVTNTGANTDFDSATLVYYGYLPADGLLVAPGATVSRSVVIFTAANPQSCGAFTPGTGIDAAVFVCRDDCTDLGATATDNCSVASVVLQGATPGAPTCTGNPCNVSFPIPGNYTYTWEAVDGSGNTAQAQSIVHVTDRPVPVLTPLPTICVGDSVTLDATATTGVCNTPLEYQFREGALILAPFSPLATFSPFAPTTTTTVSVDVRCTDNPGCQDEANTTITVVPPPTAVAGVDALVCELDSVLLDGSQSTGPGCPGGLLYEWRDGATVVRPASTDPTWTPPTSAGGTVTYTLVVTCAGLPNCASTDEVLVEVVSPPTAVAGPDVLVCRATAVVLDGTPSTDPGCPGGLLYEWRSGATVVRPPNTDPTWTPPTNTAGTTTYTLVVMCAGLSACTSSDDIVVDVVAPPTANAGADVVLCRSDAIVLDGSQSTDLGCPSGLMYEWRSGATVVRPASSNPTWTPPTNTAGTTTYTLVVTCAGLTTCSTSDTVVLQVLPPPTANAGPNVSACRFATVLLDGSASLDPGCPGGLLYEWRDGATVVRPASNDPTWSPSTALTGINNYTLVVMCAALPQCVTTDVVAVHVTLCSLAVVFDVTQATREHNSIAVSWRTLMEDGTVAYSVERSFDSSDFVSLTTVAAVGPGYDYLWRDESVPTGTRPLYRIVEYTTDGRGDVSEPFGVNGGEPGSQNRGSSARGSGR